MTRARAVRTVPARRMAAPGWLLGALALSVALAVPAARVGAQPGLDSLVPPSPAPQGFIADGGPVLDAAARARLNGRIAEVQRTTGGDIAVAVIRDLRGRAPQQVSVAIYRAWKVGRVDSIASARRNLGALLLLVPKELAPDGRGECWILTGRGAEGELLDSDAGRICRNAIIPHLRTRDYEAAIGAGIDSIGAEFQRVVAGVTVPTAVGRAAGGDGDRKTTQWLVLVVIGSIVGGGGLFVAIALFLRHRRRVRPRPCPRGHGMMVRLSEATDDAVLSEGQRTEERVGSVDYDAWVCQAPGCDEHLIIPYKKWSSYENCPSCDFETVKSSTHTIVAATQLSTGLEEVTRRCANCGWSDVQRRTTPVLPPPSTSSGSNGGGGGGGGGSGFGGSGATSGGGGGGSY